MAEAVLSSWRFDASFVLALLVLVVLYVRGWRKLSRDAPHRYSNERLTSFLCGLGALFLALASPLDAFGNLLLTAHMVQHLLLIMIAPPLILLGQPVLPILRGLPPRIFKDALGPFLKWPALRRFGMLLTHPVTTWLGLTATIVFWHIPRFYDLGLISPEWHGVEHGCFFYSAILFWWPVVQVWPGRPQITRWLLIPYLVLADMVNTALSAWLVFSSHVVYRTYEVAPRLGMFRAIDDQSTAGAIMWVPGSIVYLVPAFLIVMQLLNPGRRTKPALVQIAPIRRTSRAFDLLRIPFVGRVIASPYFRRAAQVMMFLLAAGIAIDGFTGPEIAPLNLAGVMPWTYWRGFAVIALLAGGNFFCMACPFMLPRDLARRVVSSRFRIPWPQFLRSKWLAIALLAAYFFVYEIFGIWSSPWWTALIIAGYFVTALAVDSFFRGAVFCKYVCPIGQFHFVNSLVSPLEIKVRDAEVCGSCRTHDCFRGNPTHRGCELNLFQPRKSGNFDCTFCLDCVHACPSDNVGVLAVPPSRNLIRERISGVGRIAARPDVAFLLWAVICGSLVNAAAMTNSLPLPAWMLYVAGLIVVPALLCVAESGRRFSLAMIPLGFAMWAAHFLFHLITGWHSILPVVARVFGKAALASEMGDAPAWLQPLQLLLLGAGLVISVYLAWRIAQQRRSPFAVLAPYALFAILLYAASVWILFQPMQMRGMVM